MATRSPGWRCVTEGCTARIEPADSWPRMWESSTTMGPMRPACQKWMSEPQMPVVWIPMVTSPCWSSLPSLTLSRVGWVSANQSLCSGLVKTPTLGFVRVVVVAMVGGDGASVGAQGFLRVAGRSVIWIEELGGSCMDCEVYATKKDRWGNVRERRCARRLLR